MRQKIVQNHVLGRTACWPYLRATPWSKIAASTWTTIYADALGLTGHSFDEMIKAYCSVPNAINLEKSRDKQNKACKDNHVEGLLVHNRSCKLWSGFMYEMSSIDRRGLRYTSYKL